MPVRKAEAVWEGTLKGGNGTMNLRGTQYPYTFASRFEEGEGSNPEEMLGAAEAGCFSMALSGNLERAGFPPTRIYTVANVHLEKGDAGFSVARIALETEAEVSNIDEETFQAEVESAKTGCPISRALGVEVTVNAKLLS